MANTYVKIASVAVGVGGASGITFSSIPSAYTDLILRVSYRDSFALAFLTPNMWFNGDNISSNYSKRLLEGGGSGTPASSNQNGASLFNVQNINGASSTANTFTSADIYIPNYAGSKFKSASGDVVTENNATQSFQELHAFLWQNTAAITSITFQAPSLFVQYSTATLYGIKNS